MKETLVYKELSSQRKDWANIGDWDTHYKLQDACDKLNTLRHYIIHKPKNYETGHLSMVEDWIDNIVERGLYPHRDTLLIANKLWKSYQ